MIIKNSNLRRALFENRYKILAIIIAIILFFSIRKMLSQFLIESNKSSVNNVTVSQNSDYEPEQTMVIGDNVSEEKQDDITSLMDNFISYCNSKQIEEAYNLLTDECKEELFSNDIENFKINYVEKIFTTTKTYSMQSWINFTNPTYKVKITRRYTCNRKCRGRNRRLLYNCKNNGWI